MLYEHNGKLLLRTADGFLNAVLQLHEDGSYTVTPMGKKCTSRPLGATPTDVKSVIARYQLVAGSIFPEPEDKPQMSAPKAQPKATSSVKK